MGAATLKPGHEEITDSEGRSQTKANRHAKTSLHTPIPFEACGGLARCSASHLKPSSIFARMMSRRKRLQSQPEKLLRLDAFPKGSM